jgi:PRTRC genetic system ThiF family protein
MNEAGIDLSFMHARPIFTFQSQHIALILVGTGGTGSYLARHTARLAWILQSQYGKKVSLIFVDHDLVEPANVARQDFCQQEIGLPKARALALRYTAAFGVEITTFVEQFHPDMIKRVHSHWGALTVVIGAVDNARARQSIAETLRENTQEVPKVWWLDCGNTLAAGQTLLGSTNNREDLADAFKLPGYCRKLPSPSIQHPELLVPLPEELDTHQLSCAQLLAANTQSLMVNQQVAGYAAQMLYELLVTQKLKRMATYFDQPSGTASSKYTTPETLASVIEKEASFFLPTPTTQAVQSA